MAERTCLECGTSLTGYHPRAVCCSRACVYRRADRKKAGRNVKPCEWCGQPFTSLPSSKQRTCSHACTHRLKRTGQASPIPWAECSCGRWYVARRRQTCGDRHCAPSYPYLRIGTPLTRCCLHCKQTFTYLSTTRRRDYCSPQCRASGEAAVRNRRQAKQRRRARKRGARSEPYSPTAIYERDRWTCHLCKKPVKRTAAVPHPEAPTIDHLVPLAAGGDDTPANVACAHFLCNSLKGDRATGEQLRIVG